MRLAPSYQTNLTLLAATLFFVGWGGYCSAQVPVRPAAPQQAQQQAARSPFQLTPTEQAYLDQVLNAWEAQGDKVSTFNCKFTRFTYNAFAPAANMHFREEAGEVSYQKPDKGSFKIEQTKQWVAAPVAPGQNAGAVKQAPKGEYQVMAEIVGDHWVCDGKSVFEYRHHQKQLVVQPIPADMQGEQIVNGPLPFLFGAKADDLKKRYWMRVHPNPDQNIIHLVAMPKSRRDAANYKAVELMLDRRKLMPSAMQVHEPDGSRSVYKFDLSKASVNSRVDRLWNMLFQSPRTPIGWKRVVEDGTRQAAAGAAQPQAARR